MLMMLMMLVWQRFAGAFEQGDAPDARPCCGLEQ